MSRYAIQCFHMPRTILVLFFALALLLIGYLVYWPFKAQQPSNTAMSTSTPQLSSATSSATPFVRKTVARRASFLIFTNGLKRDFSDAKYHKRSPDVYIQAERPAVVYITKSGITWGEFFNTLPMQLSKDCLKTGTGQTFCSGSDGTLSFYLRGVKAQNVLDLEIFDGDRLLATYGISTDEQLQRQLEQVPDPYTSQAQ